MNDTFQTIIVPAGRVTVARSLAAALSERGVGMFQAKLSPTGETPTTHWVSTGMISPAIGALLKDGAALHAACVAAGASVTRATCDALVAESDVSDEPPFTAFARLGLKLIDS